MRAAIVLLLLLVVAPALAQTNDGDSTVARASQLYEEGQALHDKGDHLGAAKAFAAADELVPDVAALEAALLAVLRVDPASNAAVLGMDLVNRASREPHHQRIGDLADKARARFASEVGRIVVHCSDCAIQIDGADARRGIATWVLIGSHRVVIITGQPETLQRPEVRTVLVEPGAVVTLLPLAPSTAQAPEAAPPKPHPKPKKQKPAPDDAGTSTTWFWASFALTAAVGVGAIVSAIDTAVKHAEFEDAPTVDRSVDGQDAETRTNVLLGVTGGLAVLTAVLGIFIVDWSPPEKSHGPVSVAPNGLLHMAF